MSTPAPKQGDSNTNYEGSRTAQGGPAIDQGSVISALAAACKKCSKRPCLCGVGGGSSSSSAGQGEDYIRDYGKPEEK